ncbi:PstS family phosphate ABC transporter substrate-binding protein [Youngiibacter fragilis]|uniref:Phosphate-binding protein n=1 Tax=Youngiibacter fragilis 232.1 TaxID=994573 RepID=V7I8N5_9CLOT|nr:substrate-binding domain-containing protein [Youngiibacter fragilis]ETA82218.1 phosphate-binding protein [Youngiibacter fragilis 232.1]
MEININKGTMIAAAAAAIIMLTACTGKEPLVPTAASEPSATTSPTSTAAPTVKKPDFTMDTYPRVDGSTATIPLSQGFASELLGLSEAESKAFIKHNTTHNAYVNLMDGKADIIFVTEPSVEELTMAKDKGIELEVVPVVKEAFVFLINVDNPVDVLTQKQIQDIYQGKIVNWKDIGGPDKEIIAYQRPDNSGSQTLMLSQVMKGLEIAKAPVELKPADMSGLIEVIAAYDNSDKAIGYSVYYYANSMYSKDTIKFVKVDGVEPDNKNISSDAYPYTSAYYAVLKKTEAKDSGARDLLEWILSGDGQKVSEDSGYVPLR